MIEVKIKGEVGRRRIRGNVTKKKCGETKKKEQRIDLHFFEAGSHLDVF